MLKMKAVIAALAIAAGSTCVQAALVNLGDGTVKDTDTNLLWLQDWNVNGLQNYAAHTAWAEGLTFAGSSDWFVPERAQLIALASAYAPLSPANTPFLNVVANGGYWTSTVFTPGVSQWDFTPPFGFSGATDVNLALFAVAARFADATPSVPEPQTLTLALLGLGLAVAAQKRRPHSGFAG